VATGISVRHSRRRLVVGTSAGSDRLILVVLIGSLIIVATWEFCRPRRQREFPALRRRLGNLGIWILNLVLAAFCVGPTDTFRPPVEAALGIALPPWPMADGLASFVAAFLLLDLLRYLVHRCKHAVPILWRIHALHHSDPDVDVTTAVRLHPIEQLLGSSVFWLAVILLDIPASVVLSYGLAVFTIEAIQHGNIRLPEWLERCLQPVLVTVDMHRIHHSIVYEEANANFGAVLSIWDRIFRTYRWLPRAQQERIVFGVRELPRGEALKPSAMFLTPWRLSRAVSAD